MASVSMADTTIDPNTNHQPYDCVKGSCVPSTSSTPQFPDLAACGSGCKGHKSNTLWIILGILGVLIVGTIVIVVVMHVKKRHDYHLGKVMGEIHDKRAAQGLPPLQVPSSLPSA